MNRKKKKGLFRAFSLICASTKIALLQVINMYRAQSFPVLIIATCRNPGLNYLVLCEATKYLGTGFATIQSIVDNAFIQVFLDF